MHTKPEDIAKYKGKFDDGWDALREIKYRKMIDMGLIKPLWKLTEKDNIVDWKNAELKSWYSSLMEV
jgi:arylsulfatase